MTQRLPSSFHKLTPRALDALCELTVTTEQDFRMVEHSLASGHAFRRFERAKSNGGVRVIHAPETPLMDYLRRVLRNVIQRLEIHRCVHGSHPNTSMVTNATRHAVNGYGKAFFVMDLQDAFPSVTRKKFDEVLGNKLKAIILSSVHVTDEDADVLTQVLSDLMFVDMRLPQGFPTSPGVLNAILYPVDRDIGAYLLRRGDDLSTTFRYTRYVDDLTISTPADAIDRETRKTIQKIVMRHGWKIKKSKTAYMGDAEEGDPDRSSKMPVVTGLVINPDGRVTVPRWKLRRWRGFLHGMVENDTVSDSDRRRVSGMVGFLKMVYGDKLPSIIREPYERAREKFGIGRGLPGGDSGGADFVDKYEEEE